MTSDKLNYCAKRYRCIRSTHLRRNNRRFSLGRLYPSERSSVLPRGVCIFDIWAVGIRCGRNCAMFFARRIVSFCLIENGIMRDACRYIDFGHEFSY